MAIKTKTFTLLGFIFTVACLLFLITSFASDYWVASSQTETTGFENIGLWSVCFDSYRPPAWSLVDRYYEGCWWVHDRELDDIRHYLFPAWFEATQILVTLGLVLQLIVIIVMIVNAINCFPYNPYKSKIKFGLSVLASILHALTALFLVIAVILFGARADNDRTWLEKPDQNYLSWSFGLCVLAAFLAIIALLCLLLESCRLRYEQGDGTEPAVYLTNEPPPSTNYIYTRERPPAPIESKPSAGQPGYVSRYSNQGSTNSLHAKPPNTLFAVSGAGEVYINGLAEYDDRYERERNGRPPPRVYQNSQRADNGYRPVNTDSRQTYAPNAAGKNRDVVDHEPDDYRQAKQIKEHPVLPEYVPKQKATHKIQLDSTLDESYDTDDVIKKKEALESGEELARSKKKRTASESKGKKDKEKSGSKKSGKKKSHDTDDDKYSDAGHSRRQSKKKGTKSDTSDDERSRSRRRSKRASRRSSRSRERSHSRDLNSSYNDSYSDSDGASVGSRSRRKHKHKRDSSRERRHSVSEERSRKDKSKDSKKKRDGNYTDDTGSEYSSKRKSKKHNGARSESTGDRRRKSRDFSDNESVRSKQSRRPGDKPKGTYSSYYEY